MKKIVSIIVAVFLLAVSAPIQIVSVTAAQDPIVIRGYLSCSDYVAKLTYKVVDTRLNISVVPVDTQPRRGCVPTRKPFSVSVLPVLSAAGAYQVYVNGRLYLTYRK